MINTAITVDVATPNLPVYAYAEQGDKLSRQLTITMLEHGASWTPPTGATATVRYLKPDGTGGFYDHVEDNTAAISVTGNVATVKMAQQMITVAGDVFCQLSWYTTSQRVSTFCFRLIVEAAPVGDSTIVSTDYWNILTTEIQSAIDAAERAEEAAESMEGMTATAATGPIGVVVSGGPEEGEPYNLAFSIPAGEAGPAPTIVSTTITYVGQLASDYTGTPPSSGWQSTVPTVTSGNYLWAKTVTDYGTSGTTTSYTVARYGYNGMGNASITDEILTIETNDEGITAGDVSFDSTETYSSGTVGAAITSASAQITNLNEDLSYCYVPIRDAFDIALKQGYYSSFNPITIATAPTVGAIENYVTVPITKTIKAVDTSFNYILRVYNESDSSWVSISARHTDYALSVLSSYAVDGKVKLLFEIAKVDGTSFTATNMKLSDVASVATINYLDGEYIKDNSIPREKLEGGILDNTYTDVTSSYYKTYVKDFEKGKVYRIKLQANSSQTTIVSFFGLTDATDTSTAIWQFEISVGQTYVWTPQKDYEALYYVSNGQITVRYFENDGLDNEISHVFYVGENRDITTLKEGLEKAEQYLNSIVYVDDGEYDVIEELGDDYLNAITASDTLKGLQLRNGVHVIFSSNSKVLCNYTGSNEAVKSVLSPFNVFDYGFIVENLTLECSNVRYAFHDEKNGSTEQCRSIYKNCNITCDNRNNTAWNSYTCIGGGLGSNHEVIIENCIFNAPRTSGFGNCVYYHQSNDTSNPLHSCNLKIYNNYFINGLIYLDFARTDATWDTNVFVTNNNYIKYSGTDSQGIYSASITGTHTNLYAWNNNLRNS